MNIKEVTLIVGKDKLADFYKFMYGQTVGITKDGVDYYPYDVYRFVEGKKYPPGWD